MHKGGEEYPRLIEAFERILAATLFFGTDTLKRRAKVIHRSRFNFLREVRNPRNEPPSLLLPGPMRRRS